MSSFYDVLEVAKSASQDEIKKAYKKKAFEYHPDRNKDPEASKKFQEVSKAYETLGDVNKRKAYDNPGFGGLGGLDGSWFESIFRSQHQHKNQTQQMPLHVKSNIIVSMHDSIFGCTIPVEFNRLVSCGECRATGALNADSYEPCHLCGGRGSTTQVERKANQQFIFENICSKCGGAGKHIKDRCKKCNGSGYNSVLAKENVEIPANIPDNCSFVQYNSGNISHNGQRGNLYIYISIEKHPLFYKDYGTEVYCDLPLTYAECVLGCKKNIPTPEGMKEIDIPPQTQHATIIPVDMKNDFLKFRIRTVLQIINSDDNEYKEILGKLAEAELKNLTPAFDRYNGAVKHFMEQNK